MADGTGNADAADVVVVGGGGAGLAAASAAARFGGKVVLLEKAASLGGSTAWSVGSITVTGTPHQRRAGIKDSPDAHFEDLGLLAGNLANRDNLALRRILVDNITDTFDWLMSTGLEFAGPSNEAPHRVPRMHNVLPSSKAFPYHLGRHCRQLGVDIRLGTSVVDLLRDGGRVTGVVTQGADGARRTIKAHHGVILASGDYSGNAEMKRALAGDVAARAVPVNVLSTGDGQRLGEAVGGTIVNGDVVGGPKLRFVPPPGGTLIDKLPPWRAVGRSARLAIDHAPASLLRPVLMSFITTALGVEGSLYEAGAILVNSDGKRFADERASPAEQVALQPGGIAYVVLDGAIAKKFSGWPHFVSTAPGTAYAYLADYKRNRRDIYHEAPTIAGLAEKLGVTAVQMHATLDASNAEARVVGRPILDRGPFIALGPMKAYMTFTDGGLAVNERMEVTGQDGQPIPGLYAAGSAGQGGVILNGHGHHLGWAFVSGRIAGRNAALAQPV